MQQASGHALMLMKPPPKVSPLYRGVGVGGPFDGKMVSRYAEKELVVWYDPADGRAYGAQVGPTAERPCVAGRYLFDDAGGAWVWEQPEEQRRLL